MEKSSQVVKMDMQADQDQATSTTSNPPKDMGFLSLRIVLLATLLFGLNAWSIRHMGNGLREFAVINTFLAFVGIVLGWIEAGDADNFRARIAQILKRMVDTPVLVSLYLITVVSTSFLSSVTVIADGRSGNSKLFLSVEGSERCANCTAESLKGPSGVVHFMRFTSIFGRPYYLEASGYQRKGFTLYPWTGATISLSHDLVRLPTIVLRIPHSLHNMLKGGKFVLDFNGDIGSFEIPMMPGRASVQLGPAAAITEELRNDWSSQLRTLDSAPETLREKIFRKWLNPIRNETVPFLTPMQRIQVRYLNAADKEVINQELVVGMEPLQDVVMTPKD